MDSLPLHFIRPAWLLALPLAVLAPLGWRYLKRPSGDWARVCDPHLLKWLSTGQERRGARRASEWWAGLCIALASLALAGPSWQKLPDSSYSARDARVVALDLSASMLAEDLKPNRLTQVRFRLSDLLGEIREGQVGMVAFAGDAYVVSPLTGDTRTIANLLPALRPDIMPAAGSRADRALEMAAELLKRAGVPGGEILLITDSANAADIDIAERLAKQGIRTSVLAVGTEEGAPIPSGAGFVVDANGGVVIVRLQAEMLRRLASAGGGRFTLLDTTGDAREPWSRNDGSEFSRRDEALDDRWRDGGPWLVLVLLPCLAAGFRRGVLFVLPLALLPALLHSPAAHAGWWEDLWLKPDQQAQRALENERAHVAATLAEDPAIEGQAWYRAEEYERASAAWSQLHSADAHYNRGNALAHAGDFEGALSAYDAALELEPAMEDALFNRSLVERLLERQQNQDSEAGENNQDGEQERDDSGEASQSAQAGEGQESEPDPQEEQGGQGSQGTEQDTAANWTEEDAQAMEQWLRRIPDDPGGLLRRKFRSQHQQRGAPPDEETGW